MKALALLLCSYCLCICSAWAQLQPLERLQGSRWEMEAVEETGLAGPTRFVFHPKKDEHGNILVDTFKKDEKGTWILHSNGLRYINPYIGGAQFVETTSAGQKTEGLIFFEGKDIIYQYDYLDAVFRDVWHYLDEDAFHYTVGKWNEEAEAFEQVYLESHIRRMEE